MENSYPFGSRPQVSFAVERILGISDDGNYQVQWAPAWVSKFHLVGCEQLIQEFLEQQAKGRVSTKHEPDSQQTLQNKVRTQLVADEADADMHLAGISTADENGLVLCAPSVVSYTEEQQYKVLPSHNVDSSGLANNDDLQINDINKPSSVINGSPSESHMTAEEIEISVKIEEEDDEEEETFDIYEPLPRVTNESFLSLKELLNQGSLPISSTNSVMEIHSENTENSREPCTKPIGFWSGQKVLNDTAAGTSIESPEASEESAPQILDMATNPSSTSPTDTHNVLSPPQRCKVKKPHRCGVCSKQFSSSSLLKTHLRSHSGEKPFECTYCEKRFSIKAHLKTHLRSHTGERPYTCSQCPFKCSDPSSLNRHQKRHTGEKPYKCSLCGKAFSRSCHLKRHQSVHLGNKPPVETSV